MNIDPAENRDLTDRDIINQRNPHHAPQGTRHGVLHGTDFRHAVEFSRSGRTRHPANPLALDRGGFSTLRRPGRESSPGSVTSNPSRSGGSAPGPAGGLRGSLPSPARSRRAQGESYVHRAGGVKPVSGDARHPSGTGSSSVRHLAAGVRPASPGPPRGRPATGRRPRRRTSPPPGSQSDSAGTASASVTRSLFRY